MRIAVLLRPLLLVAFCLTTAFTGTLAAQSLPVADPADRDPDRAMELFENGAILYEEGQYDAAVTAWTESYRLSGEPLLFFNIANALERMAQLERSLYFLNQYRAYAPAEERERLDRRIRAMELRFEEQRAVERAERERLEAEEEARAIAAAQAAATTPAAPGATPPPMVVATPQPVTGPSRGVRIARISLYSVAGAALATGGTFAVVSSQQKQDATDLCDDRGNAVFCPESARDALDGHRTSALIADIGFGVGGAALIGAIVTHFVRGSQAADTNATAAAWEISPRFTRSGGGIVLDARF